MAWPSLPLVRVQFAVPATLSTIGSSLDESTDAFDEMLNSPKDDVGADATTLGLSGVTPPSEAFDLDAEVEEEAIAEAAFDVPAPDSSSSGEVVAPADDDDDDFDDFGGAAIEKSDEAVASESVSVAAAS